VLVVGRPAAMRSDLVVHGASDVAAGRVATVALAIRQRFGPRGNWVTREQLAARRS